jgi:hypothetical protein
MAELLDQVVVTATREPYYNVSKFLKFNLLKSSKFAVRIIGTPTISNMTDRDLRSMPLICDSVEFPGQQLSLNEYRIPGRLKRKTPHTRELTNEVTLSMYFPTEIPLYSNFSSWIESISPTSTDNLYYEDIIAESIDIFQFDDMSTLLQPVGGLSEQTMKPHMKVKLYEVFPTNLTSMPSNWADDGFHKINVTFHYNDIVVI